MDKHVDLSPGRSWHTQSKPAALISDLDGTLADTDIPLFVHTYKPDSVTGVIVDLLLARANIAPSRRCSEAGGHTVQTIPSWREHASRRDSYLSVMSPVSFAPSLTL